MLGDDPASTLAWPELITLLRQADVQLAYWIGLRGRGAHRVEVMIPALKALVARNCEPNWIMEIFPSSDWPEPSAERFWRLIETDLTIFELLVIADAAQRLGSLAEARRLLRQAVGMPSGDLTQRHKLVALLENCSLLLDAEQVAKALVEIAPRDVEARLALARIQSSQAKFAEAAATLEALLADKPNAPHVLLEYGRLARYSYERVGSEEAIFERAGDLAGGDGFVLETVGKYFLLQLDYVRATKYYDRLFTVDPGAWANPVACRHYSECLSHTDRKAEAEVVIARAIDRCRDIVAQSDGEGREAMLREQARLLSDAGHADESVDVLRSIQATATKVDYMRPEYLPETPARLTLLRELVEGRDLLILLQGPSFSDFAAHAHQIAGQDFVSATLGAFPPVEDVLVKETGRYADLVLLAHPSLLQAWHGEFTQFLERPASNMLLTTRYALSSLVDLGESEAEFVDKHDARLLFVEPSGGPPLPSKPLHFEDGGSLALILPLLLQGRPRRIFLFGADGGATQNTNKRPYFFYDNIDSEGPEESFVDRPGVVSFKRRPERLEEANRRWRIDAINNDRIITFALKCQETIFDIPIPPIFNVCPHSTHAIFKKIDCTTAIKMLKDKTS